MLKQVDINNKEQLEAMLQNRNHNQDESAQKQVLDILEHVKKEKDQALFDYTSKWDKVDLACLEVSEQEVQDAQQLVEESFKVAMQKAKDNIIFYHKQQQSTGYELQKEHDVYLGQIKRPLTRVGVYVPGGSAAYPSTVLMDVLPAKLAGVKEIVMVTPPQKDGSINPYILYSASLAGVDKIYKVGGAQAIAALAYGTQSIPKVDKIVGPGNVYVALAKRLVFGLVDIDMIAGPSEILVVSDEGADPSYVAADLMSQAEHDPLASSILISTSQEHIDKVNACLIEEVDKLPRKEIMKSSFQNYGYCLLASSIEEAISCSNLIAPEHLELMVQHPKQYLSLVEHAGSVFLGYDTCEAIGDYFGGTNHVLPTSGSARFSSGLGVDSFMKKISYLHWSKEAILEDGKHIVTIAKKEGLDAHAYAVQVRMK